MSFTDNKPAFRPNLSTTIEQASQQVHANFMPSLLISGDCHQTSHLYAGIPEMWGDNYWALFCLGYYAQRLCADAVILAGDIFETATPPPCALYYYCRFVEELRQSGIHVAYVTGQHDMVPGDHQWAGIPSAAIHLHNRRLNLPRFQKAITGLDYQPPNILKEALKKVDRDSQVLVAHQLWEESVSEMRPAAASLFDIPPHITHVFSGDYHVTQVKRFEQLNRQVQFVSPGPLVFQSSQEGAVRRIVAVDRTGDRFIILPIPGRPVVKQTFLTAEQVEGTALHSLLAASKEPLGDDWANLPQALQKPLLIAKVTPGLDQLVRQRFGNDFHLHLQPIRAKSDGPEQQLPSLHETRDKSLFEGYLETRLSNQPELYPDAVSLWRSASPESEVQAIIDRKMKEPHAAQETHPA